MPNYATSAYKKPNGKSHKWAILYEDGSPNKPWTFTLEVSANLMSEATCRAINYIEENKLHLSPYEYNLTVLHELVPKPDFTID